jgi:glycosyltransferase involved in cell wall biosynthesis
MEGTSLEEGARPWLTVVVPAYNEAARIAAPLAAIHAYLRAQPWSSEVVVVDDGSADATFALVREVARDWTLPVRAFRYQPNAGKGYAIKYGIAHARGERILFTDADLSTPIDEATRLLAALDAGADVAIGSRKMAGAHITRHQPWLRERLGKVFTWMVRKLIADVSDVTCGFKAFRGEAARDIFSRVRVFDWSFDAEVLLLVRQLGYRLSEVAVDWADCPGTKVRLGRDVLRSLEGLLRIRGNAARGLYATPTGLAQEAESWESLSATRAPAITPAR